MLETLKKMENVQMTVMRNVKISNGQVLSDFIFIKLTFLGASGGHMK